MYGTGDRVSHSDITVFHPIAESQRFPGPQGHGSEDAPVAGQRVPTALRNTSAFLRARSQARPVRSTSTSRRPPRSYATGASGRAAPAPTCTPSDP